MEWGWTPHKLWSCDSTTDLPTEACTAGLTTYVQASCSASDLPYFLSPSHSSVRMVLLVSSCTLANQGTERVRAGPRSQSMLVHGRAEFEFRSDSRAEV